jgi:alpha-tubulin suppressor-like RCC1 family protein
MMLCYIDIGHGDSSSKNLPTRVKDLPLISQVSCGSSHTIVVARDGKTVWSFGSGDSGTRFFKVLSSKKVEIPYTAKKE